MLVNAVPSVRHDLAEGTRQAHVALHGHPWISLLSGGSLTRDHYAMLLRAYHQFYQAVEEQRRILGLFAELSLLSVVIDLGADLKRLGISAQTAMPPKVPRFGSAPALVGGLYVLHGARFGAATMRANVMTVLPDAPVGFLGSQMPAVRWRDLIGHLERIGQGTAERTTMIDAANATFCAFGKHVTACCTADGSYKGPEHKNEAENEHHVLDKDRQFWPDAHAKRQQNRNQQAWPDQRITDVAPGTKSQAAQAAANPVP